MGVKFNPFTSKLDIVDSPDGDFDSIDVSGNITLEDGGAFNTTVQAVTPTANRTISFPDATGTVALVSGANGTIQYNDAGTLKGNSDFTVDPDWNDASTVFTGLKLNVTDGSGGSPVSAAGSNLLDLQVGGASKVTAKADGRFISSKFHVPDYETGLYTRAGFARVNFEVAGSDTGVEIGGNLLALASTAQLAWVTGTLPSSSLDVAISRSGANTIKVTDGSTGTGYIKQDPVAISALPDPTDATGVGAGTRGFVNDASSTTFAAVVAIGTNDGGSTVVPVYSDGTNWRIG